jgi:uncharacterized protein YhbP (UPF0306 family)
VTDRAVIDRVLATNRYVVLGTADRAGQPWVTPVFFALLDADRVCWVSSPESRHSRNIADRAAIAITAFDSTVEVGEAGAAYFDADAAPASPDESAAGLQALNARLPLAKQLGPEDLQPEGQLVVYRATLRRRYVLVRGGDAHYGNVSDMTLEV